MTVLTTSVRMEGFVWMGSIPTTAAVPLSGQVCMVWQTFRNGAWVSKQRQVVIEVGPLYKSVCATSLGLVLTAYVPLCSLKEIFSRTFIGQMFWTQYRAKCCRTAVPNLSSTRDWKISGEVFPMNQKWEKDGLGMIQHLDQGIEPRSLALQAHSLLFEPPYITVFVFICSQTSQRTEQNNAPGIMMQLQIFSASSLSPMSNQIATPRPLW